MNPINSAAANPTGYHLPPLNLHRPSFSLRSQPPSLPQFSLTPIRASLPNPNSNCRNSDKTTKLLKFKTPNHEAAPEKSLNLFLAPLKTTILTTAAAAALLHSGFYLSCKPSVAAPISPPADVETTEGDFVADEEREKYIEEHLVSNPNDLDALKNLMEIKIKSKKAREAIDIIDKLIELEPEEMEWPMMKAHLHAYNGDLQLAKKGFYELINKDPLSVEAYQGLMTVASQEEPSEEFEMVERRIEEAIKLCKEENKESDLRDFRMLLAQIRVLEGKYDEALKFYQELVKEEPRDFSPFLCRGIIYTLMGDTGEADKCFEVYRKLAPKGHPYASYFDQNMMASKLFAQRAENERAMAKN